VELRRSTSSISWVTSVRLPRRSTRSRPHVQSRASGGHRASVSIAATTTRGYTSGYVNAAWRRTSAAVATKSVTSSATPTGGRAAGSSRRATPGSTATGPWTEEEGASGAGLAAQRRAIRVECDRRGWTLVRIEEDVLSGKTLKRPGLTKLLKRAARARYPGSWSPSSTDSAAASLISPGSWSRRKPKASTSPRSTSESTSPHLPGNSSPA